MKYVVFFTFLNCTDFLLRLKRRNQNHFSDSPSITLSVLHSVNHFNQKYIFYSFKVRDTFKDVFGFVPIMMQGICKLLNEYFTLEDV